MMATMETTSPAPRIGTPIPVDGTYNFRSTAGYTAAGGVIRAGSLFRSDALHLLSPQGVAQFAAHRISRVIDLRGQRERQQAPSALPDGLAEIVHHPIVDDDIPAGSRIPTMREAYLTIATDRAQALAGAVRHIADAPAGGVLVHCTAGKDRTGLVVALTLTAVGVSRDDVLADYAASAENLAGEWVERMIAAAERFSGPIDDNVRSLLSSSPADVLAEVLDVIDRQYGGTEHLLLTHGFDAATLTRLRDRLVA